MGSSIRWEKGKKTIHETCPPSQSPKITPAGVPTITVRRSCGRSKPSLEGRIGKMFRARDSKVLIILGAERQYFGEDGLSFGLDDDSGWLLRLRCREATPEEREPFEAEEASAAKTEADRRAAELATREAKKAATDAEILKFTTAIEGLVRTETWEAAFLAPLTEPVDVVAQWSLGETHSARVLRRRTLDAVEVIVLYNHDFDDERDVLYAPRPIIEAAWESYQARAGTTREASLDFLGKYKDCVGVDYHRWNVDRQV